MIPSIPWRSRCRPGNQSVPGGFHRGHSPAPGYPPAWRGGSSEPCGLPAGGREIPTAAERFPRTRGPTGSPGRYRSLLATFDQSLLATFGGSLLATRQRPPKTAFRQPSWATRAPEHCFRALSRAIQALNATVYRGRALSAAFHLCSRRKLKVNPVGNPAFCRFVRGVHGPPMPKGARGVQKSGYTP